jgi:hypothetical protein
VERVFAVLMVFTACSMAFAHGSNDVANAVGPLAAIASIVQLRGPGLRHGGHARLDPAHRCPGYRRGPCHLRLEGHRHRRRKITELTPSRGFAAELAAASTVVIASATGLPISTTHTLVGAVLGVGLARGIAAIDLRVIGSIFLSWVITLPAGAVLRLSSSTRCAACLADAVNEPHPRPDRLVPQYGAVHQPAPRRDLRADRPRRMCRGRGYLPRPAHDVALLSSLGVRLVLVYGSRPQIEAQLAAAGMDSRFHGDTRITDADAMPLLQAVVGAQRIELEALLSMGLPNSPMQGAQLRACGGNFVGRSPSAWSTALITSSRGACGASTAARSRHCSITAAWCSTAWAIRPPARPSISPRGRRDQRRARARRRQAHRTGRVRRGTRREGRLLRQCVADESGPGGQRRPPGGGAAGAGRPRLPAGVPRCHIVSYRMRDALLTELFTTDGSGTLVSRRPFEQSRWAVSTTWAGCSN